MLGVELAWISLKSRQSSDSNWDDSRCICSALQDCLSLLACTGRPWFLAIVSLFGDFAHQDVQGSRPWAICRIPRFVSVIFCMLALAVQLAVVPRAFESRRSSACRRWAHMTTVDNCWQLLTTVDKGHSPQQRERRERMKRMTSFP